MDWGGRSGRARWLWPLVVLLVLVLSCDAHADGDYNTPGYGGLKRAPQVSEPKPPPPITLGTGEYPDVLVDAAGTAHIVWSSDPPTGADVLEYCRLPRGATACAARASLVPGAAVDEFGGEVLDVEMGGPTVLAIGSEVALLTHRYPNIRRHPGGVSDRTTWLYTSDNGGDSFGDPGIIGNGEASGGAIVYGSDPVSIGVISDTRTGGTFFQGSPAGQYVNGQALLGEGDAAYEGRLALLPDGRPLAAFADLGNHILVREWTGQGSPNDAATWTPAETIAGEQPRVAGGPTGTYLLSRPDSGAKYEVRQLRPTPGPPTVLSADRGAFPSLSMDATGGLHAAWVDSAAGAVQVRSSSAGGGSFAPAVTLDRDRNANATAVAAAGDGGGFAVWSTRDGAGPSTIKVGSFGARGPTGQPGLGSLPGGSGVDEGSSSCGSVKFGAITALAQGGCFLADPKRPNGAKVSTGPVRFNGLDIIPEAGARIVIDRRERTLDTFGSVRLMLGDIELRRGELHIKLPSSAAGTILASFDTSDFPVSLKGFPIKGSMNVELTPNGVRIPVSLELPAVFGGVRGNATLLADNNGGLHLDSLHIAVENAPLGPLLLHDLVIDYQGAGEVWDGKVTMLLPPQGVGGAIAAEVRFEMGAFKRGFASFTPPAPGIALGPGVFLTELNLTLELDPTRLAGGGTVVAGPQVQGRGIVDVRGTFDFRFPSQGPSILSMGGDMNLASVPVADANFTLRTDGTATLAGNMGIDIGIASVTGKVRGFLHAPTARFDTTIDGEVCAKFPVAGKLCVDELGLISSKGVAMCAGFDVLGETVSAGYGYHWGDNPYNPDNLLLPCDVGDFRVAPARTARAAQAGAGATVPRGAKTATIRVIGSGGAPAVTLTGPGGATIATNDAPEQLERVGNALILRDPQLNATYVMITGPAAGAWQVAAHPGSAPIASVSVGVANPVAIKASVARRGAGRVLRYDISGLDGRVVRFAQEGGGTALGLGPVKGARGTLSIAPDGGAAGPRTIVALVERNGIAVERREVARYTAPAPRAPARPRGLRVTRNRGGLVVRWGGVAGATNYQLRVDTAQGKRLLFVAGPKARRQNVPGIARYDAARVSLIAVGAGDRRSAAAQARAKAATRLRA